MGKLIINGRGPLVRALLRNTPWEIKEVKEETVQKPPSSNHLWNCNGYHCEYPGHEWFCLPKFINYPNGAYNKPVYCHVHFREALGLPPYSKMRRNR